MENTIAQIINIQIIPVILLPVTGLISLVFYNRAGAIHQRLRYCQKESRELILQKKGKDRRAQETLKVLGKETALLHRRSNLITLSLISCLLAVVLFSLCAFFVALGLFFSWAVEAGLVFWFIGPVLICIGVISGMVELVLSRKSLPLESDLIDQWSREEE